MKRYIAVCLTLLPLAHVAAQPGLVLRYDRPAEVWTEAIPIGNGRLGAMVFGGAENEQLQLNEATLWSGGPVKKNINPDAFRYLAPSRAALTRGDFAQAKELLKNMQGAYTESYLPLADVLIKQQLPQHEVADYERTLNLSDAIATTQFSVNGTHYRREVFASAPANIIVMHFNADRKRQLSLQIGARSSLHFATLYSDGRLILQGKAPAHVDPSYFNVNAEPIVYDDPSHCNGMRFEMIVKPMVTDGVISYSDGYIAIKDASEVVLLISAATSFNGFDHCPDSQGKNQHEISASYINKASRHSVEQLRNAHVLDYRRYFDRVNLMLNPDEDDHSSLTTTQRLDNYTRGATDSALEALYFQYGRYLLISSSRTPGAPANLQGIWNKDVRPPWSSNYTTNINLQMNYWPVETANLSELSAPLNDLINHVATTGRETATSFYHAPGWVLHHNSDIWAATNPVGDFGKGDPMWANWYMGANWLSRHLWEHYLFTGDRRFLASAYPIMKGAAEFSLAWLQPFRNYLVTMPSTSPENVYYYGDHQIGNVTIAATMDMSIIRDLFSNVIAASTVLNKDAEFRKQVANAKTQLYPLHIGSQGQLQEWYEDFTDIDSHHRHTSHLYGLHPATEISPLLTPEFAFAAKRTLELRGDDGTGWSLAWKINMWARLLDGDHAYRLLRNLLRITRETDAKYGEHGGAYPNLFDAHPPFQIDGNLGGTAGMIEMLLQSQNSELHLLPALPSAWKSGSVSGLVGRGNFVVNMRWSRGQLDEAEVYSRIGGPCTLRSSHSFVIKETQQHSAPSKQGHVLSFNAKLGKTYHVSSVDNER